MSTPLPSSVPPRGSLMAVPSTQNTAPVIKFRCLYTYDIRRKAKRWNDGFLRYHTFNKRVMVYDPPGNFIGDHHWRQDEEIQDGDELELDKGVLIQVCECMEKTQTDLSPLFQKKISSQGSPRSTGSLTQAVHTSTPMRPSTSASSQTPRSLSDLLGIKRTPIGRAVVPKSPYEERHTPVPTTNNGQNSERAAKRQKTLSSAGGLHEKSPNAPIHAPPAFIDLSEPSTTSSLKKIPITKPASGALGESRKHSETRRVTPNTPAASAAATPKDTPLKKVENHKGTSSNKTMQSSSRSTPISRLPEGPVNTLRMSTEKPRKKLMYRALIPNQAQGQGSSSLPLQTTRSIKNNESVDSHETEANVGAPIPPGSPNSDFDPPDLSLFLFDDTLDDAEQPQNTIGPQKPLFPLQNQEPVPVKVGRGRESTVPSAEELDTTEDCVISFERPIKRKSTVKKINDQMLPDSNRNDVVRVKQKPMPPPPAPIPAPATINNTTQSNHISPSKPTQKQLRKSLSDPASLITANSSGSGPPLNHNNNNSNSDTHPHPGRDHDNGNSKEQGPWTLEALDLFDFWPPGRPKPN